MVFLMDLNGKKPISKTRDSQTCLIVINQNQFCFQFFESILLETDIIFSKIFKNYNKKSTFIIDRNPTKDKQKTIPQTW